MKNNVELKNVKAIYDKKLEKIVLIAKDKMFDKGFKIVLKDGTNESNTIKEELLKNNSVNAMSDLLIPDVEWDEGTIPLGKEVSTEKTTYWDVNYSNILLINGKTGTGAKTLTQSVEEHLLNWYDTYSVTIGEDGDIDSSFDVLTKASEAINERIAAQMKYPNLTNDNLFFIVYNIDQLFEKYGYGIDFFLKTVLDYGSKVNVNLVIHSNNKGLKINGIKSCVEMGVYGANIGELSLSDNTVYKFNPFLSEALYEENLNRALKQLFVQQ